MSALSKIVVIHDALTVRGGATIMALQSARLYRELGFDVTYISAESGSSDLPSLGIDVVEVGTESLRSGPRHRTLISGLHSSKVETTIGRWIAENDTPQTAYHLHNWAQSLSPSIFKTLRPVESRVIMSCHDVFNICPNGGLINYKSGKPCSLKPMSAACWGSQCDRRSSLHKYWRMARHVHLNQLARFNQSQITFVCLHKGMEDFMRHYGFNPPHLTSVANPATAYTSPRVEVEKNNKFLFVGRLGREKGVDILAEAASKADVNVVFVGNGELSESLKEQHPNFDFPGFCDRPQLAQIAKTARALVVPSRWPEPFGLVIAEAALSGIPIIISEPSLLSKAVVDLEIGHSFDPMSPPDLQDLLTKWAVDDKLVRRLSSNAIKNASGICTTNQQWAAQMIEIMQSKVMAGFKGPTC